MCESRMTHAEWEQLAAERRRRSLTALAPVEQGTRTLSPTQMTVDECIALVEAEQRKTLQEVMNEWPPAEPVYGGHN